MVKCYSRKANPVPQRSSELAKLQKDLLDAKVRAGVLPQEVASKVTTEPSTTSVEPVASVSAWQEKVRRVTRLLYRQGELSSHMVRALERAIDAPILKLEAARALRSDAGYYLRGVIHMPYIEVATRWLVGRRLIPRQRNHRGRFLRFGVKAAPPLTAAQKKLWTQTVRLAQGTTPIVLPQDGQKRVSRYRLPAADRKGPASRPACWIAPARSSPRPVWASRCGERCPLTNVRGARAPRSTPGGSKMSLHPPPNPMLPDILPSASWRSPSPRWRSAWAWSPWGSAGAPTRRTRMSRRRRIRRGRP